MEVVAAKVAAGHPLRDRLRFVEVGANLGDCVLWAAAYGRARGVDVSALAYEPHKPTLERLLWTAKVNGLAVQGRAVGISSTYNASTAHFFVPDHRTAESGFHIGHGAEGYDFEKVDTWEVPIATLDEDVMRMWPWTGDVAPVDMLKLTTNGDEVSGLNSAQELLRHGFVCSVIATVYRITLRRVLPTGDYLDDREKIARLSERLRALTLQGGWVFGYYRPGEVEYAHPVGLDTAGLLDVK